MTEKPPEPLYIIKLVDQPGFRGDVDIIHYDEDNNVTLIDSPYRCTWGEACKPPCPRLLGCPRGLHEQKLNERAAFLMGEGTLPLGDVQAWAAEIRGEQCVLTGDVTDQALLSVELWMGEG